MRHETNQDIKETSKALSELSKTVLKIDSRQAAILRLLGGLVTLITLGMTIAKAFNWFQRRSRTCCRRGSPR